MNIDGLICWNFDTVSDEAANLEALGYPGVRSVEITHDSFFSAGRRRPAHHTGRSDDFRRLGLRSHANDHRTVAFYLVVCRQSANMQQVYFQ